MESKKKKSMVFRLGLLAFILGAGCILLKAVMPETIDADGMLHEAFFLLPIGFAGIFGGGVLMVIAGFRKVIRNRHEH